MASVNIDITIPTVVRIATPEHNAKPILMIFSTWFRARYCPCTRFFAQTKPTKAAQITTANFAKEPILSTFANCCAAAISYGAA